MIKRDISFKTISLLLLSLTSWGSFAGGVYLYEIGSDDVGLAAAGYSARAQDPFTIYTNPAGMTRLEGEQASAGLQLLYDYVKFTPGRTADFLGTNGGNNPIGLLPGASAFYQYSLNDSLKTGIGLYGNFGSILHYESNWLGRYNALKATLIASSIQPTIAYRITSHFSFGAGLVVMSGYLKNTAAIRNSVFEPDFEDGQLKISDITWGVGANLGLLYELDECTRIGLSYLSPIKLNFSSAAEFTNLSPTLEDILLERELINAQVKVGIRIPQGVMASVFHQVNAQWALLSSLGWQNWKRFGQVDIGIDSRNPVSLTANREYKDTWHLALGTQYQLSECYLINFGIGYDSEFQNSNNIPVAVPANSAWRFGLGTHFNGMKHADFGIALEYIYGGNLDVNHKALLNGDFSGQFKHASVYFASFNVHWRNCHAV